MRGFLICILICVALGGNAPALLDAVTVSLGREGFGGMLVGGVLALVLGVLVVYSAGYNAAIEEDRRSGINRANQAADSRRKRMF